MRWRGGRWWVSLGVFAGAILASSASFAQVATPSGKYAGTSGSSCAGLGELYAWPDANGQILKCVSNLWTIVTQTAGAAGSTGQVQFNISGALGASSIFFWDNTNNRLGIGTAVPSVPFNIVATTADSSGEVWHPDTWAPSGGWTGWAPTSLTQVTATANTNVDLNTTGVMGWVDAPASNSSQVENSIGVEGLATNEDNSSSYQQIVGVGGEVYNGGTLSSGGGMAAVDGYFENDGTQPYNSNSNDIVGGSFGGVNIGTAANPIIGVSSDPAVGGGTASGGLFGVYSHPFIYAGTLTGDLDGIYVEPDIYGGTADYRFGLFLATGVGTPSGSGTNDYGIYQESTAAVNYFGGRVGIGVNSPVTPLQVGGSGAAPSLSADNGLATFTTAITPELQIGGYPTAPYAMWMQVKRTSNDGTSWPLVIQPLGGSVGIGTAVPIAPLNVVATLSSSSAGYAQYWVPSITQNNTEYPGELVKVTATQNTTGWGTTDGALDWVDEPSSNTNAVGYAQGVEGLVRIQSTTTPNYGAAGVDGEVYLTGTMNQRLAAITGVTGGAENDPGASNSGAVVGGGFSGTVAGGTVAEGVTGIEALSGISAGTVTNGIGGIYTQSNISGGTADWRYGIFLAAGAGTPSGSSPNDFGVFQESTAAVNYFGGSVGIGTMNPYSSLTVLGATGNPSLTDGTASAATIGGSGSYVMSMGQNSSGPPWYYYMQIKHAGLNISGPLAINPLGGGVGIGTTVPFGTLHVRTTTDDNLVFINNTDMGTPTMVGIVLNDADNNIEPLEFAASAYNFAYGNVGIGTTSPAAILDVRGGSGALEALNVGNTSSNYADIQGFTYNGWSNGAPGTIRFVDNNFSEDIAFLTKTAGANTNAIVERMRITAAGKVGIGSTSPATLLDVAGTTKLGSAGTTMTAMGTCTVASYTPTSTAANKTCTGVPASASVAVSCSASAAFTTPNTTVLYARATGTASQIAVNLSVANSVAVTLTCMWVQP